MRHTVTRVLSYSPEQLFDLVGDVEAYPAFVPWILSMRTWNKREAEGVSQLDAEVQVGFSFLRERFSTHVRRDAKDRAITVSLLHGPFKRLVNRWRFAPDPAGTQIQFDIDFEFSSRLLDELLEGQFPPRGRQADRLFRGSRRGALRQGGYLIRSRIISRAICTAPI